MENLMPKVRFVFDRRKEAEHYKTKGASKTADVLLELYYRQKRKWYKTGVKVFAGQWDTQKWVINRVDSAQLNNRLSVIMSRVNAAVTDAVSKNCFSVGVVESVFRRDENDDLFETEFEKQINILRAKGMKQGTISTYTSMFAHLTKYGKIKRVEDLNFETIDDFKNTLEADETLSVTSVRCYLSGLRSICTRLTLEGRLAANPFANIKIKKSDGVEKIRYLTEEELDKIEQLKLTKDVDVFVRDFFIFQANTGMAFSDARAVKLEDVVEENGRFVLRRSRKKTAVGFAIVLLPKAMEILRKYGRMDLYTNYYMNTVLHFIGLMAIDKEITTHMARHSFAVKALRHGVPIEYVSKMLGHTNINTTQRYAKVLALDVLDQFEKLM